MKGHILINIFNGYEAWYKRFLDRSQPLVYAWKDEKIVSAILGRTENHIQSTGHHTDFETHSLVGDVDVTMKWLFIQALFEIEGHHPAA